MPDHPGHALAREVVEDGKGLVRARSGGVQTAPVKGNLDKGAIVARRALERPEKNKLLRFVIVSSSRNVPRMLPVCHCVDPDVPVLTCREDVFVCRVHLPHVATAHPEGVL